MNSSKAQIKRLRLSEGKKASLPMLPMKQNIRYKQTNRLKLKGYKNNHVNTSTGMAVLISDIADF